MHYHWRQFITQEVHMCVCVYMCACPCLCVCEGCPAEVPGPVEICTSHRFTLQQVVYSEPPSNQPSCAIFNAFSAMISSKRSSIEHKHSPMVSQIALTSKSELTWVMSSHFSTVTVTIHFATSVLHSTHMMQEDVRLLFTSLRSAVEECVCMCTPMCTYMCRYVHCRSVWVVFCVEWASLFFF